MKRTRNNEKKLRFHLWDIQSLVQEFISGTLTESIKVRYYIASSVLLVWVVQMLTTPSTTYDGSIIIWLLETLILTALMVYGVWWCYRANSKGDGRLFIERIVCLGFVVSIRIIVVSVVSAFMIGILYPLLLSLLGVNFAKIIAATPSFMPFILTTGLTVLYFWLLRKYILQVSLSSISTTSSSTPQ